MKKTTYEQLAERIAIKLNDEWQLFGYIGTEERIERARKTILKVLLETYHWRIGNDRQRNDK